MEKIYIRRSLNYNNQSSTYMNVNYNYEHPYEESFNVRYLEMKKMHDTLSGVRYNKCATMVDCIQSLSLKQNENKLTCIRGIIIKNMNSMPLINNEEDLINEIQTTLTVS